MSSSFHQQLIWVHSLHICDVFYDKCYKSARNAARAEEEAAGGGGDSQGVTTGLGLRDSISSNGTDDSRHYESSISDPLDGMDDETFECRFEEELRGMLHVDAISPADIKSLRATKRIKRKHGEFANC